MNILDIVLATILVLGFISGFMKGLFSEIASLVAIIAGIYVAIHFSYYAENFLTESILDWSEQTNKIAAYIITFLGVVLLVVFIGKILTKMADIVALGLVNKALGGVFSMLKIALIFSIIFVFLEKQKFKITFLSEETLESSVLYTPIKEIFPTFFPTFIDETMEEKSTFEIPNLSL